MKKKFYYVLLLCSLFSNACKKSAVSNPADPQANPLITLAGSTAGNLVTARITAAAGGDISSEDGLVSIHIPAGALTADTTIGIQPVTNTAGVGNAVNYRLTPHNITFNVPVTIRFKYTASELTGTSEELLRAGYQTNDGAWRCLVNSVVNKQQSTITATSMHFSDWGYFAMCYLDPSQKTIHTGDALPLKVMYCVDPKGADLLVSPDGTVPMNEPELLNEYYIRNWMFSGAGSLQAAGATATYMAPSQVPSQNPVAVSVDIRFGKNLTCLLVSNILIVGGVHIDYMQVDETEVSTASINYISRLLIYGNFGNDPGVQHRSVKVGNVPLTVMVWSPNLIICEIAAIGPASSGIITVSAGAAVDSKLLNEWQVELKYEKRESPNGSLTKKINFNLVFRGDAVDFGGGETSPLLSFTDINKAGNAEINMDAGSYSNAVQGDGCGTYTVHWDAIHDVAIERTLYGGGGHFTGQVQQTASGFGVKLKCLSENILRSQQDFAPCVGAGTHATVFEPIEFEGYHEEVIWFNFTGTGASAHLAAGAPPEATGTGVATGLYWDAQDFDPSFFTRKIYWAEVVPKY